MVQSITNQETLYYYYDFVVLITQPSRGQISEYNSWTHKCDMRIISVTSYLASAFVDDGTL